MRLELVPVFLGFIVLVLGAAVLWDAWGEHPMGPMRERRRRTRATINARGESSVGFGMLLLGAALIGRDWRFETITVLAGTLLVLWGGFENREYIREMLFFRGAARRGLGDATARPLDRPVQHPLEHPLDRPLDKPDRLRIR